MKEALVLMAKAPIEGMVKTRLVHPPWTAAEVTELYQAFLRDTITTMEEVWRDRETLSLVLCYTPEGAEETLEPFWEGGILLPQGSGDLGARLTDCFETLRKAGFDRVVVVGADCPTLPPAFLLQAFDQILDDRTVVLGPTRDGGYYLLAAARLPEGVLSGLPWSTDQVLAQTVRRLEEAGSICATLPILEDVDTPEDLSRLEAQLAVDPSLARSTSRYLEARRRRMALLSTQSLDDRHEP
jgi:rSAM/selenodomain-associated transferase 1